MVVDRWQIDEGVEKPARVPSLETT